LLPLNQTIVIFYIRWLNLILDFSTGNNIT